MPGWILVVLALAVVVAAAVGGTLGRGQTVGWRDAAIVGFPIFGWLSGSVFAGVDENTRWTGFVVALIVSAALAKWRGVPFR
jgi:hypothetical protein